MLDVQALRRDEYPWTDRDGITYLNNASIGPLPARAIAEVARFNAMRGEPHRITHEHQFGVLDRARERCARMIGAGVDEIALMVNTGYGINLAARALPLAAGDVVVAPDREFPANVYPWLAQERRGVRLELLPCVDGLPDEEALLRAIERPEVKVCAVSWVSFATGARVDLARLGAACRANDTFLVVDAIQGVGAACIDVHAAQVDMLACGAQKWLLGPWGTGFLYVRRDLVRRIQPADIGWMATRASEDFSRLLDYDPRLLEDARRFEMITLPFQDFVALSASLDMLLELGLDCVEAQVASLADRIIAAADAAGITLATPRARVKRAGVLSLRPRDPEAASARLTAAGVIHSMREGAVRLAPHCYNTPEEVDRAVALVAGG